MHRACPAHPLIGAADMGSREAQAVAQEIDQQHAIGHGFLMHLAVDGDADIDGVHGFPPRLGGQPAARASAVAATSAPSVRIRCLRYSASAHRSLCVSISSAAAAMAAAMPSASSAVQSRNAVSAADRK